jgi:hypothetical protein
MAEDQARLDAYWTTRIEDIELTDPTWDLTLASEDENELRLVTTPAEFDLWLEASATSLDAFLAAPVAQYMPELIAAHVKTLQTRYT